MRSASAAGETDGDAATVRVVEAAWPTSWPWRVGSREDVRGLDDAEVPSDALPRARRRRGLRA